MKDRSVEYPGRIQATDVLTGDVYIFDVERAEGNVSEAGTPYNTANVLSDATAAALGLTDAATPDDAFNAIASWLQIGGIPMADWDFKTSIVDTIKGITAVLNSGATLSASGVSITGGSGAISLPYALKGASRTYEIKIGSMTLDSLSNHHRFFMATGSNGLIYRDNGKWSFYSGSWATDSTITDYDYFANSTMKIKIDIDGYWHIYKDDTLVYEPNVAYNPASASGVLMIGSTSGSSCTGVDIEGLTIYNE